MKLTKTQWIIVAVVAGVAIWYFFLRKKDEGTKKESGYTNFDLDGGSPEYGYMGYEVGPGVESGYGLFGKFCKDGQTYNPATKKCEDLPAFSSYSSARSMAISTAKKSLYNTGQICRKDNQCGGGLKCINGRCAPVVIPKPVKPTTTDLFPTFPKPTTTTIASGPRGGLTETLGGTGVVSPKTPTLSGAMGMTVETNYMM